LWIIFDSPTYYSAVQIKKNEIDGPYGGEERCLHDLVEKPDGKRLLGRPGNIYGRIILKWVFNKWDGIVYGIDLSQDRGGLL